MLGLCNFKRKPLETCVENNNLATKISVHPLICQGREGVWLWLDGIRRREFSGEGQSTCAHLPLWTGFLGGSSKSLQSHCEIPSMNEGLPGTGGASLAQTLA